MRQLYQAATLPVGFPRSPRSGPPGPVARSRVSSPDARRNCTASDRHLAAAGGRLYIGATPGGLALADPQTGGPGARTTPVGQDHVGRDTECPGRARRGGRHLYQARPVGRHRRGPVRARPLLAARPQRHRVPAPGRPGTCVLRWSPVASATTWDESLVLARAMSGAARPSGRAGESAHWTERAEALLAPLLHAAHLGGAGMDTVLRWVLRQELEPAQATLTRAMASTWRPLCSPGIAATDPREQSGIWSTTAGLLAAYRSDAVLDRSGRSQLRPSPAGRHRRHRLRLRAGAVIRTSSRRSSWPSSNRPAPERTTAGPPAVGGADPLTLVLDELANIAPLPDLPAVVSEGGGQGLLTLACLQDLSQARVRWGPAADGFLSLFGTKVVLPAIGDLATLEVVSRLGGEVDVPARSVSSAAGPVGTADGHVVDPPPAPPPGRGRQPVAAGHGAGAVGISPAGEGGAPSLVGDGSFPPGAQCGGRRRPLRAAATASGGCGRTVGGV